MNDSWKQDPRLKSMNPEKIKFLTDFAEQLNTTPKDQMLARLIAFSAEARRRNISFSDQETRLLTDILINYLTPADRSRFDRLRSMTR